MAVTTWPRAVTSYATMLHLPRWSKGSGLRAVLVGHGYTGASQQAAQGGAFAGHPEKLADAGYAVMSVDMGGSSFLNTAAMSALTAAYNDLIALGAAGTKVGLIGWSMGGGSVLRWMAENPAKVAGAFVFSPITDLDWAYAQAAWTTAIDASYAGSYAANGSTRGPVENLASYRGGAAVRIAHATDDATIPYSQSTAFVSAVADASVTMRSPDVTGDHQGALLNVPPSEVREWFNAHWAA